MPPRIPGAPRLVCMRPALKQPSTAGGPLSPLTRLPVTQTASLSQKEKKRLAKQEPYRWAQMQQRKNAHLELRSKLEAARAARLGDPVRGMTTPFVESFDSAGQAPLSTPRVDDDGNPLEEPHPLPTSPHVLNNLVHADELEAAIANAYELTKPEAYLPTPEAAEMRATTEEDEEELRALRGGGGTRGFGETGGTGSTAQMIAAEAAARADPEAERKRHEEHEAAHARAAEAVRRIVQLNAGSAKDRRHANIRRIVETFGRHETDLTLRAKPLSRGQEAAERPVRGGPDTGSSEVQIAILTAKIRALADRLETGRGYKDKVGKRDLRLLVHRRQRLLQYMDRKERGSDRWRHMVETLGLTEATYKRQITL